MSNGSQGNKACSVCGSSMPHMPWGTDSCEWDPKWAQLAKDRAKTVEELVVEVSGLSQQLADSQAQSAAYEARILKLESVLKHLLAIWGEGHDWNEMADMLNDARNALGDSP